MFYLIGKVYARVHRITSTVFRTHIVQSPMAARGHVNRRETRTIIVIYFVTFLGNKTIFGAEDNVRDALAREHTAAGEYPTRIGRRPDPTAI